MCSVPASTLGISSLHKDKEAPDDAVCRICWERSAELLRPCDCRGTQEYVHHECLRRWQMSVLSGKVGDYCMYERASRCPVCLQRFSLPPPQLPLISRAAKAASVAFTALCVGLLACGMISPPWPHVLLVVVLLVGVRLQAAFAVVVLLLLLLLPDPHQPSPSLSQQLQQSLQQHQLPLPLPVPLTAQQPQLLLQPLAPCPTCPWPLAVGMLPAQPLPATGGCVLASRLMSLVP
mmetsp:Transcript_2632/g.5800  ORF Transcript_2632/g.5800 Transcript_2632/m.5800 type:complete len:234 (+) Transcript_2632:306-1007(+)